MNKELLEEVLSCLSDERITYAYFKDRYCMFLLSQYIGDGKSIQELKQGPFSQFCQKPHIKQWLGGIGSQYIEPDMLMALWQTQVHHFRVTLGQWGGDSPSWQQTCRKGYNLVLQLNFTKTHDRFYERVANTEYEPFTAYGHPTHEQRNTLAWSRIDLSEDLSEALIEEVQTDWLRKSENIVRYLNRCNNPYEFEYYGIKTDLSGLSRYFNDVIKPLKSVWDEAILCATLEFLIKKVGVKNIYYYDHDTGRKLKSIDYDLPPRSLYTRLPKRFGFHTVSDAPEFIQADKFSAKKLKRIKQPQWYYLPLTGEHYAQA
ncbi:hypothetical protein [Marinicella sp. W31]|uniref:hypothetical protein n=1 Tax=Marinicella sp. W31 TaxID=3023713 RepID=UPI0037573B21